MFRKPVFWVILILIFIASVIFTFRYFSSAFPMVTLDIKMDRQTALKHACELAQKHNWGPEGFKQAASFDLDRTVQNFVELEAGGNEAFKKMLEGDLYSPFRWCVRHFKEGETNETLVYFTPAGEPYGFFEKLSEDEPGASLTSGAAGVIAETAAKNIWQIDLSAYKLVEASQEIRPGGRKDHEFVYERPDVQVGEGHYRLCLTVSGDRFTELTHFIEIPEAFLRRYQEMYSANNTIAFTASAATRIFIIGSIIGLFLLFRQNWVIWKKPLFWGLFVAFLQVLADINEMPLAWMSYDTAISIQGFLLEEIVALLTKFLYYGILLTAVFMAAESFSRKAFPHHIQLWRIWSSDAANSPSILGRTVSGYLLLGILFAFKVTLYFSSTKLLNWWVPSGALFEPDMLATYFPWLSSIAISLRAGFFEECLFRAIPIAGAALLGQRFGRRRAWIAAALIIQAVIFGAAHANYPQQPAYARVVELIIPSLSYGIIYIYFGLLPIIILHFTYDVIWMAMPLFVSSASGIWIDQMSVVILALVPLLVVFYFRYRSGRWGKLKEEHYNRSWLPPEKKETEPETTEVKETTPVSSKTSRLVPVLGLVGLVTWLSVTDFKNYAPPLTTGRKESKELAGENLSERGIELTEPWQVLSSVRAPLSRDDRFVWQTGSKQDYKSLIGNYLTPPYWKIRFVRFEGDVAERAEEYQVSIADKGEVFEFCHQLPEARPGASLTEDEARDVAYSALRTNYGLDPSSLKEVSVSPFKLPSRKDWVFTFADTLNYPLTYGEARIDVIIAGNEVSDFYRYIHVPEEWIRQERNRRNLTGTFDFFCSIITVVLIFAGVIGAVLNFIRRKFSIASGVPVFFWLFGLLFVLHAADSINSLPGTVAWFSTAKPLNNQIFTAVLSSLWKAVFLSGFFSFLIVFVRIWKRQQSQIQSSRAILLGVSLGSFSAGLSSLVIALAPSLRPAWANYIEANTYFPVLGIVLDSLMQYVTVAALALFVFTAVDRFTEGWTQRKVWFSIVLIFIGIVVTRVESMGSLPFWIFSGLLTGSILLFVYQFVFRFHLSLVPLVIGMIAIFEQLQQAVFRAYPAMVPGSILAIFLIAVLSIYWYTCSITAYFKC